MPKGRPKKVKKEIVPETPIEPTQEEIKVTAKSSLEDQLNKLNDLRTKMINLGIDTMGKLDILAGQIIAEIKKLGA